MYDLIKLISVFYNEKYGVWVYGIVVVKFERLLYLEITDCESVYIFIVQFLGAVIRADKIAVSSDLNKQGQYLVWAWKVWSTESFDTWTHPIPIEYCEVPKFITEPSV